MILFCTIIIINKVFNIPLEYKDDEGTVGKVLGEGVDLSVTFLKVYDTLAHLQPDITKVMYEQNQCSYVVKPMYIHNRVPFCTEHPGHLHSPIFFRLVS